MISLNDEALYIVKRKAGNTYFAFTLGPDMKLVLAFFFFFYYKDVYKFWSFLLVSSSI